MMFRPGMAREKQVGAYLIASGAIRTPENHRIPHAQAEVQRAVPFLS